jgi:glycosyltransferase involved in cell wall biosynthesis
VADARVSVALCTCNGERYLAQQLDSLLAQHHPPFELVACDDASDDGTWQLVRPMHHASPTRA